MKRGFQKCDLEESVDLALDALLASRVEHLLETVVPGGKKIYRLKWKLTNETTRGQRKWRISWKCCSGWLNIFFQFWRCGGPVRNKYVAYQAPDNNVFLILWNNYPWIFRAISVSWALSSSENLLAHLLRTQFNHFEKFSSLEDQVGRLTSCASSPSSCRS